MGVERKEVYETPKRVRTLKGWETLRLLVPVFLQAYLGPTRKQLGIYYKSIIKYGLHKDWSELYYDIIIFAVGMNNREF